MERMGEKVEKDIPQLLAFVESKIDSIEVSVKYIKSTLSVTADSCLNVMLTKYPVNKIVFVIPRFLLSVVLLLVLLLK